MKRLLTACAVVLLPAAIAHANVVTDWDAKAMDIIQGNAPAPPLEIGPLIWPKNSVIGDAHRAHSGTPEPDRRLDVRGQPATSVRGRCCS